MSASQPTDFTHEGYRALLALAGTDGRLVGAFRDIASDPPERFVLLRHDVDFSLGRALEMAELDHAAGVTATYFILLTAPYYNPLSFEGRALLRRIAGLGHEIGLHLDLTGFDALSPERQQRSIRLQADLLAEAAGQEVTAVAQHKPASTGVRVDCVGFVDAYAACWCGDIGYLSDSRMRFVEPDVPGFMATHPRLQLLTHPLWWSAAPASRSAVFDRLGDQLGREVRRLLGEEDRRIAEYLRVQAGQ